MHSNRISTLAAAIIAIAGVGIGTAAGAGTASKGVKACVTKGGYLQTASKSGSCPAHTSKVTIAKQGLRGRIGPQGPGAKAASIALTSGTRTKTLVFSAGDKITLQCKDSGDDPKVTVVFTPPTATAASLGFGTVDIVDNDAGGGLAQFQGTSVDQSFFQGHSEVAISPTGAWSMTYITEGAITKLAAHLFVTRGPAAYSIDIMGAIQGGCEGGVGVTPASYR